MEWIRKHPIGAAFAATAGLLVIGLLLSSLGSSEPTPVAVAPTTTIRGTIASADPTEATTDGPEVPPIACGPLIELEEVDEALGVTGQLADIFQFSGGEVCTEVMADDEDFFVRIEPGDPSDFDPGAQLNGVSGEPVTGVGDEAVWFGEDTGGVSTISVRQTTSLGDLHYRITVSRPDANGATHREITKTLALAALPRFPGVEPPPAPEPILVAFEPEPVDLSDGSYVDNLLVKEEDGEWTRGEGLVATLGLFAGEVDRSQVLRHSELLDYSGTGVIVLARDYLESGPEEEAKTEIARLLDQLYPSREQLAEITAVGSGSPEVSALLVSLVDVLVQEEQDACPSIGYSVNPCLLRVTSPELEATWPGQFGVLRPLSEEAHGWSLPHIDATVEALRASIVKYQKLAVMPPVDIILMGVDEVGRTTETDFEDGACGVFVHPSMQEFDEDFYQQFLARDIAYCLIADALPEPSGWWSDGLANYLSGYVYPEVNLEHLNLPWRLEDTELSTPLLQRRFTNWVFFEHLHPSVGPEGILSIIAALPGSISTIENEWHHFNEKLTDTTISDIGPGDVPYKPPFEDVQISGPTEMTPTPEAFGLARAQIIVDSGKKACVSYSSSGSITTTWRSGVVGTTGGSWSGDLPAELSDVAVFVVTATKSGAQLTMKVNKVVDQDKDCEDEKKPADDAADCQPSICDPSAYYH